MKGQLIPRNNQEDKENIKDFNNINYENRVFGKDISNKNLNNTHNPNQNMFQSLVDIKKVNYSSTYQTNNLPIQLLFHNSYYQSQTAKPISINTEQVFDLKPKKQTTIDSYLLIQDVRKQFLKRIEQMNQGLFEKDKSSLQDPQLVAIYADQIFKYLKTKECEYKIDCTYMTTFQEDINEKMRVILIDWMIDVQVKFKIKDQTLFMFIYILDRYLQSNKCTRMHLQLVGVAVMFLCCKYEEIYAPELKDFVYVSDNSYSKQQILEMEANILNQLQFNLNQTTRLGFFERFAIFWNPENNKQLYLAKYILELTLLHIKMHIYQSSTIAAATIYLVNKLFRVQNCWDNQMQQVTGFSEQQIRPCAKELCMILQNVDTDLANYTALKRKYGSQKYMSISNIKIERMN